MPFVGTADRTGLFYNDGGAGKPVVPIHGWPLHSDMWEYRPVFPTSHGLRVIAYDRRGFGRSGQYRTGYDFDTLSGDLKAAMDRLDLKDATLVGFSMGGGVAKSVPVSAVKPSLPRTDDNPEGVERGTFGHTIEGLRSDGPSLLTGFGRKFFETGMLNFGASNEFQQWALTGSPKATLDCVRAFSETGFRCNPTAIEMPTPVIYGGSHSPVPRTDCVSPNGTA